MLSSTLILLSIPCYLATCQSEENGINEFTVNGTQSANGSDDTLFSVRTLELYDDFMTQYAYYQGYPDKSVLNISCLAQNPLFTRTQLVQSLYEYVAAATKDLYPDLYAAGSHHVECLASFTHSAGDIEVERAELLRMEEAVQRRLHNWPTQGFTNQEFVGSYAELVTITESIQKGLAVWDPDQRGIVATRDIPPYTAIGNYFGDEYLHHEGHAQFPWRVYWNQPDHPFRKKWDYFMEISYTDWVDPRLKIPKDTIVLIDGYFDYDHSKYIKEGGQDLDRRESETKASNIEYFVNDARASLYKPTLSEADLDRKNSEFVYCAVDGIIIPFFVVQNETKSGQQLFAYYGPKYG